MRLDKNYPVFTRQKKNRHRHRHRNRRRRLRWWRYLQQRTVITIKNLFFSPYKAEPPPASRILHPESRSQLLFAPKQSLIVG